jgi:hypothetical protein
VEAGGEVGDADDDDDDDDDADTSIGMAHVFGPCDARVSARAAQSNLFLINYNGHAPLL